MAHVGAFKFHSFELLDANPLDAGYVATEVGQVDVRSPLDAIGCGSRWRSVVDVAGHGMIEPESGSLSNASDRVRRTGFGKHGFDERFVSGHANTEREFIGSHAPFLGVAGVIEGGIHRVGQLQVIAHWDDLPVAAVLEDFERT